MSVNDENSVVADITEHGKDSTDPAGDLDRPTDFDDEQRAADPTGGADTVSDSPKD